jgi:hypothetical protein
MTTVLSGNGASTKGHLEDRDQLHAKVTAKNPEIALLLGMAKRLSWGKLIHQSVHDNAVLLMFANRTVATVKL